MRPVYLEIAHGERVALIQITCDEGRKINIKKALFARLAQASLPVGAARSDAEGSSHDPVLATNVRFSRHCAVVNVRSLPYTAAAIRRVCAQCC